MHPNAKRLGAYLHPPGPAAAARAKRKQEASRADKRQDARKGMGEGTKADKKADAKQDAKIGANTTAPAKARSVTAGPNGSFPIGDAKHARLAIGGATRSERAGNISAATAAKIKAEARAKLKKGK